MIFLKVFIFIFFILTLASCGGGSSEASSGTENNQSSITSSNSYKLNSDSYVSSSGTSRFIGYLIRGTKDYYNEFFWIVADLTKHDSGNLYFEFLNTNEWSIFGRCLDDSGNRQDEYEICESHFEPDDEGNYTWYNIKLSSVDEEGSGIYSDSNKLVLNTNSNIDPYSYEPENLEGFEQFFGNLSLDFDPDSFITSGEYGTSSINMGLWALPKSSPSSQDSSFIGYTLDRVNDQYVFIYLFDYEVYKKYENNYPAEGEILGKNLATANLYTSYLSKPDIVLSENIFRVLTSSSIYNNISSSSDASLISGSKDGVNVDPGTLQYSDFRPDYAVKYIKPSPTSDFRFWLKSDVSTDCHRDANMFYDCIISNSEIYFKVLGEDGFYGLSIDPYNSKTPSPDIKILVNLDD